MSSSGCTMIGAFTYKDDFWFDAINITIGLPFVRISPDHGPNYKMFGMNKSKPDSLIQAFSFLNKYVVKA